LKRQEQSKNLKLFLFICNRECAAIIISFVVGILPRKEKLLKKSINYLNDFLGKENILDQEKKIL